MRPHFQAVVIKRRQVALPDDGRRMMAAEAADLNPVHEHVIRRFRNKAIGSTPRGVGVEQLVDIGRHFPHQRCVPGVIVVIHQHLHPTDRVAGVKVMIVFVLQNPCEFSGVLLHEPRQGKGVVVDVVLDDHNRPGR